MGPEACVDLANTIRMSLILEQQRLIVLPIIFLSLLLQPNHNPKRHGKEIRSWGTFPEAKAFGASRSIIELRR